MAPSKPWPVLAFSIPDLQLPPKPGIKSRLCPICSKIHAEPRCVTELGRRKTKTLRWLAPD